MKIKEIEIYGYGKWVDTKFDLSDGLQVFLGQNEAGKSTLMSFIHSILFGFPTRSSIDLRYEPRTSSKYGGKILLEDSLYGEVIVERVHGKVTGDVTVTLEDGTVGSEELLKQILKDVDQKTFKNLFSFSLSDIQDVHQLTKSELSRYLLNVGAHGTERYLNLVDDLRDDANELYRPSGKVRPLNIQLNKLETIEKELIELEKYNENYLSLIEENKEYDIKIHELERKKGKLEGKLEHLKEIKKEWHVYEEIKNLEKKLSKIELPPLKKDGHFLLEEYEKNISQINQELEEVKSQKNIYTDTLKNPEIIDNYLKNKKHIEEIENNLPEIIELLNDYKGLEKNKEDVQEQIAILEYNLKIQNQISTPMPFSKEEINIVNDWIQEYDKKEEKMSELNEKAINLENKLNLKHQKLDQFEELMWKQKDIEDIEMQIDLKEKEEYDVSSTSNYLLNWKNLSVLILASISGVGVLIIDRPLKWISAIISIILLFTFIISLRKNKNIEKNQHRIDNNTQSLDFLTKQYKKQVNLKENWRTLLNEIDSVQITFENIKESFEMEKSLQESIQNNWKNLLMNHYLADTFSIEEASRVFKEMDQYIKYQQEKDDIEHSLFSLNKKLEQKTSKILMIIKINNEPITERVRIFRDYLKKIKDELAIEQANLTKLEKIKQKTISLKEDKKNTTNKINHLLEATGVETRDNFIELYKEKENFEKMTDRLKFLKENVPSLDNYNSLSREKEEINHQIKDLITKIETIVNKNKRLIRKQANVQLTIEKIEADGTYAEKIQIFENEKSTAQNLIDEWISNKLAAGIIQKTLNLVTKERFSEIIEDAEKYFSILTDDEYVGIDFKEDNLFVKDFNGTIIDVKVLSRGTAEPLYIAIRLAYIVNTSNVIGFPIIMDDPFVNFDQIRKINIYNLLKKLEDKIQIIYFTFDAEVLSYFNKDQIIQLKTKDFK